MIEILNGTNASLAQDQLLFLNDSNYLCQEESLILYESIVGIKFAVPQLEAFLTAIFLGLVILVTIIGNILVIMSVFNYRPLRIAQNFFIVSLAVADFTVAILVLPFNVMYYLIGKWIFGIYICKMWLTSDILCCTASILNLCAIALDRYWAITDPINYARKRTLKRVIIMIIIIWGLSALISSPPLIGWNDWPIEFDETTPCRLTSEKGYVIYSSLGSFFIPLLIMAIVYVQIFIATRRRLRERAKASKMNAFKGVSNSNNKRPPISEVENSPVENKSCVGFEENSLSKLCSKNRKTKKKKCKRKEECSQHSLLVYKQEESISDNIIQSVSPGLNDSSEGNDPNNTQTTTSTNNNIPNKNNNDLTRNNQSSLLLKPTNNSSVRKSVFVHQFIEEKQRISLSKERKAARTLGIIMGVFVVCWLPFFLMYVIQPFCLWCCLSNKTVNIITWLGYINSALNPFIYTIFNMDFRKAFKKILHLK